MENLLRQDPDRLSDLVLFASDLGSKYELKMAYPNTHPLLPELHGWVIEHPAYLRHPVTGNEAYAIALLHQSYQLNQFLNRAGFSVKNRSTANDPRYELDIDSLEAGIQCAKPWTKQNLCRIASYVRTNRFSNDDLYTVATMLGDREFSLHIAIKSIGHFFGLDAEKSRELLWTCVFTSVVAVDFTRQINLQAIARCSLGLYLRVNPLLWERVS